MEQFSNVFEYMPAYCIVICRAHHQGILKSEFRSHLDGKHKEWTIRQRRAIIQASGVYQEWANTKDEVTFPTPVSNPVPHLEVYRDGFQCMAAVGGGLPCSYIRRSVRDIQKHCQDQHGWTNSRKRGRPNRSQKPKLKNMWTEGVSCQKFQPSGKLAQLFEVRQPADAQEPVNNDHEMRRAVELSLTQATANLDAEEKKRQARIEADNDRFEFSAWLDRAGWARHLRGFGSRVVVHVDPLLHHTGNHGTHLCPVGLFLRSVRHVTRKILEFPSYRFYRHLGTTFFGLDVVVCRLQLDATLRRIALSARLSPREFYHVIRQRAVKGWRRGRSGGLFCATIAHYSWECSDKGHKERAIGTGGLLAYTSTRKHKDGTWVSKESLKKLLPRPLKTRNKNGNKECSWRRRG
jgi:hypothetical protein